MHQASRSFTTSQSLLRFVSIESVMPSNHLILCRPLLLLPSVFPSIRVFSNESALCIRWPKYWRLSFSVSPSNEYSGLMTFGLTDLISLQFKRFSSVFSSTGILQRTAFFMVELSHLYTTAGKTIVLTTWTFVSSWECTLLKPYQKGGPWTGWRLASIVC